MRKITQIATAGGAGDSDVETLFALCNDGTVWRTWPVIRDGENTATWTWHKVAPIPQSWDDE